MHNYSYLDALVQQKKLSMLEQIMQHPLGTGTACTVRVCTISKLYLYHVFLYMMSSHIFFLTAEKRQAEQYISLGSVCRPQSKQSGNGHFLAYIPSWWKNQWGKAGGCYASRRVRLKSCWDLPPWSFLSSLYSLLTLYRRCGLAYPYDWRGFVGTKKKTSVGLSSTMYP